MIEYGFLIARLCLATVFLYSGVEKLWHWRSSMEEVKDDELPWPAVFACLTILTQLFGGLMVATGFLAWLGALLLAYYDPDDRARLVYADRARTGIDRAELERLWHPVGYVRDAARRGAETRQAGSARR